MWLGDRSWSMLFIAAAVLRSGYVPSLTPVEGGVARGGSRTEVSDKSTGPGSPRPVQPPSGGGEVCDGGSGSMRWGWGAVSPQVVVASGHMAGVNSGG